MTNRVPYASLTADEKTALHAWFDSHGVSHRLVPIDPEIRIDPDGRVHVRIYSVGEDGKRFIRGDDVAKEWVAFWPGSPMPWRSP